MDKDAELAIIRRAYAKQVLCDAETSFDRLENAFAEVRREDYLGRGPWPLCRWWEHYIWSPSDDPVYLYTNDPVGIDPGRRINNGQPSFHARLIAQADPAPGEHVVHIGAGVGYYTAILATMVGDAGRVTAVEFDKELAERSRRNLSRFSFVTVLHGSGADVELGHADVIYVNAGVTRPENRWLDAMSDGGRMILPLTSSRGFSAPSSSSEMRQHGGVFLIERRGNDFTARLISAVRIVPAEGLRDSESEARLGEAFVHGRPEAVTRLYRRADLPEDRSWVRGTDWSLAYS